MDDAATGPLPQNYLPTWVDFNSVSLDLKDDGVSAPPQYVDGLRAVVENAQSRGLDLKIVYTEAPAVWYTQARDLATMLAQEHAGTVFVRTPMFVGTYSDSISRAALESGQDDAYKEVDPVLSATVFENKISEPAPPWGALTTALLLALVLAVAVFIYLIRRR